MKQFLLLILFPLFSFQTTEWLRVQIDEKVSVEFPSEPQKKELQGRTMWLQDVNDQSRCMIMPIDLGPFGLDSTYIATHYDEAEFLTSLESGMVNEMPGCKIIDRKRITSNGFNGFEFIIEKEKPDESFVFKYIRIHFLFVGSMAYPLYFYEKENANAEADRNRFFDSFSVKQ